MTKRLVVTLVALLAASVAAAQPPASGDVVIGRREVVHSAILGEDRPILVSLPPPTPGLPPAGGLRYPVMVLLDGDWQFGHTVAATMASAAYSPPPACASTNRNSGNLRAGRMNSDGSAYGAPAPGAARGQPR